MENEKDYICSCTILPGGEVAHPDSVHAKWCPASINFKLKEVKMNPIQKNLHHIFLVIGILFGFYFFAAGAKHRTRVPRRL